MAFPKKIIKTFFRSREDAAIYVYDLLMKSDQGNGLQLTMTINQDGSGAFSVAPVTEILLDTLSKTTRELPDDL